MAFSPRFGGTVLDFNTLLNEPGYQDVYLHATLNQIKYLANEDVEMQPPVSERANYLVVDTNILLHHLEILQQFVEDVERLGLPTTVIIPGIVIQELDRQKKRDGLGFFARRGSSWLLEKVGQRRSVKGQAYSQTCKASHDWSKPEPGERTTDDMYNDNLILDCCMFFASSYERGVKTFLCSADNNLCILSESQGIKTIVPNYHWSSRDIALGLYGTYPGENLSEFSGYKESYRNPLKTDVNGSSLTMEDDDTMMVDATDEDTNDWRLEHPLNLLHEAVIDHFTRLLIELVGRVGGQEVRQTQSAEEGTNLSRHAPRWRNTHFSTWSVAECLEYLNDKKGVKPRNPPADRFLLLKTRSKIAYARRGWEWARRDWEIALGNLRETAVAWGDVSIPESLIYLQPHLDAAFAVAK